GLALQQLSQQQVVVHSDDGTSRYARDHLDVPQEIQLGQTREDTDMKQRSAEASAREGEPQLAVEARTPDVEAVSECGSDHGAHQLVDAFGFARIQDLLKAGAAHQLRATRLGFPRTM